MRHILQQFVQTYTSIFARLGAIVPDIPQAKESVGSKEFKVKEKNVIKMQTKRLSGEGNRWAKQEMTNTHDVHWLLCHF